MHKYIRLSIKPTKTTPNQMQVVLDSYPKKKKQARWQQFQSDNYRYKNPAWERLLTEGRFWSVFGSYPTIFKYTEVQGVTMLRFVEDPEGYIFTILDQQSYGIYVEIWYMWKYGTCRKYSKNVQKILFILSFSWLFSYLVIWLFSEIVRQLFR